MARRRYQRGTVYIHSGRFYGRFREDEIRGGRRVRIHRNIFLGVKNTHDCPTSKIARRRLDMHLARVNAVEYRPGSSATVEQFAALWRQRVVTHLKPSTIKSISANLHCHILPLLGAKRLDELCIQEQQLFIGALADRRLGVKSIRNILGTLSSMLRVARRWGFLAGTVNTRELVFPDGPAPRRPRAFTGDDLRRILGAVREPFRAMFSIAAVMGLRAGEVLGLAVDDVDLARRVLWVRQSAWHGVLQTVKTKSSAAALPLPDALAARLATYLRTWTPNPQRLLFANRRGRPFSDNKIRAHILRPALERLGLYETGCGFHAFRHAHASLLVDLGATPAEAQAQLRHSDVRTTLSIYTHVVGDGQRRAVDRLAAALLSSDIGRQRTGVPDEARIN